MNKKVWVFYAVIILIFLGIIIAINISVKKAISDRPDLKHGNKNILIPKEGMSREQKKEEGPSEAKENVPEPERELPLKDKEPLLN